MVIRHLLAILILPVMAAVVMPAWLLTSFADSDTRWSSGSPLEWLLRGLGVALLTGGLALFSWCVIYFAKVGRGTLAPWDPPSKLVAVGPYRYSRNPMITGVVAILAGEALIWGSWVVGLWAAAFVLINHTYFILLEEPDLEARFGAGYLAYKTRVPRWIPRWTQWEGSDITAAEHRTLSRHDR